MSGNPELPKRARLPGSEELFRDTRYQAQSEPPAGAVRVDLTPEELRWIVDAIQLARYPELQRQRPTITHYERLGELQDRLRKLGQDR